MPLVDGSSRAVISANIRELIHAGHPHAQAVAAALRNAGKHLHKKKHLARADGYACSTKDASGCPDAPMQLMQPTHEQFQDAIGHNSDDAAPKLMYADYLDENEMPGMAEAMRHAGTYQKPAGRMQGPIISSVLGNHPSGQSMYVSVRGSPHAPQYPSWAEVSGIPGGFHLTTDMNYIQRLVSELHPAPERGTPAEESRHNEFRRVMQMPPYQPPQPEPQQLARPQPLPRPTNPNRTHHTKLSPRIIRALGGSLKTGWIPVDSSWIDGLRYTPGEGAVMSVKKTGKEYPYGGLGLKDFKRWLQSSSKGKWWWRNVHDVAANSVFPQEPAQLSRWTGPVHALMTPHADGPIAWDRFNKYSLQDVLNWGRRHIHPAFSEAHLAGMTGWVPGTSLGVLQSGPIGTGASNEPRHLTFNVESPFSSARTMTGRDFSKSIELHGKYSRQGQRIENQHTIIAPTPGSPFRGLSGAMLLRQMRAAHEMGVPRINWFSAWNTPQENAATGGMGFTGGLHWPLMGADGYLHPSDAARMPPEVRDEIGRLSEGRWGQNNQFRFSDLAMSKKARDWYVENPSSHDAFVETAPGSYSRTNIERHVAENAANHGFAPPIPDHMLPREPLPHGPSRGTGLPPTVQKIAQHFTRPHRRIYHPALEHLIATGSLHPNYYDDYFCH